MQKILVMLVFFMYSLPTLACDMPIKSPEIDELINVSKNDVQGSFTLKFPNTIQKQPYSHTHLSITDSSSGEVLLTVMPEAKLSGLNRSLVVNTLFDSGYEVSITIWWQGKRNPCPIVGRKVLATW